MIVKLCECGCGLPAPIAKETNKRYGHVKGEPMRFIHNHHHRGARNVNYNGGLCFFDGRWFIRCRDNGYCAYARAVMEAQLGRPLSDEEVVHHKDRNPLNDSPDNLQLCKNQSEHKKLHSWTDEELLNKLRELATKLGRIPTSGDVDKAEGMPTRETYRIRLGGLRKARELAFRKEYNA